MKLDKAIKDLQARVDGEFSIQGKDVAWDTPLGEAYKLSFEALKVYKKSQEAGWYPPGYKLPGETPEED